MQPKSMYSSYIPFHFQLNKYINLENGKVELYIYANNIFCLQHLDSIEY